MVWRFGAAQKKFNGSAIEKVMNFLAVRKWPAIPQNDPKTGRFVQFRAVRGLALLPNI